MTPFWPRLTRFLRPNRHPPAAMPTSHPLIDLSREIAGALFSRQDIETVLGRMAEAIRRQFNTHVQVFLIDPGGQHAVLRAATGEVGQRLLDQEYALDIGGLSSVGRVTLTGKPLLIADTHRDPIHKIHPLLSHVRSELALPLVASEEVIGALVLQSDEPYHFQPDDTTLLQAVATQIALAVDGLRVYEMAQRNMRENQALLQQSQASLREIERLNYQLTGRAWTEYLRIQGENAALTLDLETGQAVSEAPWTPTLDTAARLRQVVTSVTNGQRVIALPILVRNEVIGAMEFELASDADLPEGAHDLIAAVGQRLGLALENRRLFDETQRVAQREALINDIGAELQSTTGVDAILQRAAYHLQEALAAQQVTIRLGTADQEKVRA